jgi:hypothetical protein
VLFFLVRPHLAAKNHDAIEPLCDGNGVAPVEEVTAGFRTEVRDAVIECSDR